VREAHPIDGTMPSDFGLIEDPIDDKERAKIAGTCVKDLELPMPALVDHVDNKVQDAYDGWPDRLYLVGKDGKIAYAGARGPRGFDPDAWDEAIKAEKSRNAVEQPGSTGDKPPEKKAGRENKQ
jgi:type I thyroxine 5'-deiodinase